MSRSHLARALLSSALAAACVPARGAAPKVETAYKSPQSAPGSPAPFCAPGQSCWPSAAEWQALAAGLDGKLEQPRPPLAPCHGNPAGAACSAALRDLKNPYFVSDQWGATQSTGWLDAWTAATSAYAVAAESPKDIVAAVRFAAAHRLRVAIRGTGHDYLGRSNAPDSLLIWTHKLRKVAVSDAFVPRGCPATQPALPAVTVEAGTRWLEAYQEVTVKHGRYVQGGGCTSVGAAGGFLQGGGFGSWSRKFGTGAANLLEADVVTADGQPVTANACQNADLFWALRGGGGGTFGVVTRVTLRTHALPSTFGIVTGDIAAKSDAAFQELIARFLELYRDRLNDEHWGETVRFGDDNVLHASMLFQGISAKQAEALWAPLQAWVAQHPDRYTTKLQFIELPARQMWDRTFLQEHLPQAITPDPTPGSELYWWESNVGEVSIYWYAYQSRWIPWRMFQGAEAGKLAALFFAASRHWPVALHFNKALAGAAPDAVERTRATSMNPAVLDAAALVIIAAGGRGSPGVPGHEPDRAGAARERDAVAAAMRPIRAATPGAGAYVNEADYFEPDWRRAFWGDRYPQLLAIKRKYDPTGLFTCHHCVGSDEP
jgi:FAD/FMN-containing dehydrogenase